MLYVALRDGHTLLNNAKAALPVWYFSICTSTICLLTVSSSASVVGLQRLWLIGGIIWIGERVMGAYLMRIATTLRRC